MNKELLIKELGLAPRSLSAGQEFNHLAEKYIRTFVRLQELESQVLTIEEENRKLKEQLLLNPWKRLIAKIFYRKF